MSHSILEVELRFPKIGCSIIKKVFKLKIPASFVIGP